MVLLPLVAVVFAEIVGCCLWFVVGTCCCNCWCLVVVSQSLLLLLSVPFFECFVLLVFAVIA